MKALRVIFSILGIVAFGIIAYFWIDIIIHGHIAFDGFLGVIGFSLAFLFYISLFYISISSLIGKKGNVGFILECAAVIGTFTIFMIEMIEAGDLITPYLIAAASSLVGLVLHIIKMKTKVYFLGVISSGLLLFAVLFSKTFVVHGGLIIFRVATYVLIIAGTLAYSSAQLSNGTRPVMKKREAPKKDEVKEDKPAKKEEKPRVESAPAQNVVQERKGKKFKQWTDEYGFTYTNLP